MQKSVINLDQLAFKPRPDSMRATEPAADAFDANVAEVATAWAHKSFALISPCTTCKSRAFVSRFDA